MRGDVEFKLAAPGFASGTDRQAALAAVDLLRGLRPPELERLERACLWQRYAAGEEILGQDDRGTDVLFVAAGRVTVQLYSASGQQVIFRDFGAGETFGELAAVDQNPRSASVVAASDCWIARLKAAPFWQLIDEDRTVRAALLKKLVASVRLLSERVFEFSTLTAQSRVRAHLLRLAIQAGGSGNQACIRPPPMQAAMADQLATHREAVSREMSALIRGGILRRQPDALLVCDIRRLRTLVENDQMQTATDSKGG
jgi:CRP-like cAMP-binding protein